MLPPVEYGFVGCDDVSGMRLQQHLSPGLACVIRPASLMSAVYNPRISHRLVTHSGKNTDFWPQFQSLVVPRLRAWIGRYTGYRVWYWMVHPRWFTWLPVSKNGRVRSRSLKTHHGELAGSLVLCVS